MVTSGLLLLVISLPVSVGRVPLPLKGLITHSVRVQPRFRSVMPVSRPCRLVVRSTQNFLPYFRSSPKELGEKIAFGMVDRDYLDDTLAKIESGSSEHLVLDIRETHETSDGSRIPYSMCVPASELESALDLSPKDWQKRYGFRKPRPDDEIIVYGEPKPDTEYDPEFQQRTITVCNMLAKEYGFKLVQRYSQSFFEYFNDPYLF
ncbi:hypothetical protein AAMO2058_000050600 [Amorphochlora amoebiformis]